MAACPDTVRAQGPHLKGQLSGRAPRRVNQFEVHPYNTRSKLIELCRSEGIAVNSYCPLGGRGNKGQVTDSLMVDKTIASIAKVPPSTNDARTNMLGSEDDATRAICFVREGSRQDECADYPAMALAAWADARTKGLVGITHQGEY